MVFRDDMPSAGHRRRKKVGIETDIPMHAMYAMHLFLAHLTIAGLLRPFSSYIPIEINTFKRLSIRLRVPLVT